MTSKPRLDSTAASSHCPARLPSIMIRPNLRIALGILLCWTLIPTPGYAAADALAVRAGVPRHAVRWKPVFGGVCLTSRHELWPEPRAIWAARVDLRAAGIHFLVTPPRQPGASETAGMKTSTFLETYHCQLAINATPFYPVQDTEGVPIHISGLSVYNGKMYSPPNKRYGALLIDRRNHATIVRHPVNVSAAYNAVGGYGLLLVNGKNVGKQDKYHPRTAVGVSRDGRYLYLFVIDGRQLFHSIGATTAETAEWLRWLGAYNALNLDGGGSTDLVIQDRHGVAKVLNSPIHEGIPGRERVVGNHLGVFAAPLRDTGDAHVIVK